MWELCQHPLGRTWTPPSKSPPELSQPVTLQGQGPHPLCFSLANSTGMSGFGPRHQECHLQLWSHGDGQRDTKPPEPIGCGALGRGTLA